MLPGAQGRPNKPSFSSYKEEPNVHSDVESPKGYPQLKSTAVRLRTERTATNSPRRTRLVLYCTVVNYPSPPTRMTPTRPALARAGKHVQLRPPDMSLRCTL